MNSFWSAALINTLVIMVGVTALSAIIALPAAWLVERTDVRGRHWLARLLAMPYAIPSFLLAISWIALANPNVGWINLLGAKFLGRGHWVNIYSLGGIVFVESSTLFSILFLNFSAGLKRLDPSLEEAARLAGAGRFRIFARIHVPILKGPISVGVVSIALAALASFGVPAMIGVPARIFVLTTGIYSLIREGNPQAFREALWISGALALFATAAASLLRRLTGEQDAMVAGKSSRASIMPLGRARTPISFLLWGGIVLLFVGPAAALLVASFQLNPGGFAAKDFGWRAWHYVVFNLAEFPGAVFTSVSSALITATFILGASSWLAVVGRHRSWLKRVESASLVLYSLPGTALALLLIAAFGLIPGAHYLFNTVLALSLAYSLKYFMLGLRTIVASSELVHESLVEAARLSGAKFGRIWWRIWLPLLRPALIAAFVLCLIPCLAELTMSVMLYGPETQNLGVLLFQLHDYADRSSAAVIGSLVLGAVFLFQVALSKFNPLGES